MKNKYLVSSEMLQELGYPKKTSDDIIRRAKENLSEIGFKIYDIKSIRLVPAYAVEEILAYTFSDEFFKAFEDDKEKSIEMIKYLSDEEEKSIEKELEDNV